MGLAEVIQRVHRDQRGDEAARDGPDGPKTHGRRPPELRAEVADERRSGHEYGPFDHPE